MSEKILNSRMVQKHDIEANWLKATNFTPLQGELIVYDVDENYNYERIKMGDGITNVNELPFISLQADWNQNDENALDYVKNRTHYAVSENISCVMNQDFFLSFNGERFTVTTQGDDGNPATLDFCRISDKTPSQESFEKAHIVATNSSGETVYNIESFELSNSIGEDYVYHITYRRGGYTSSFSIACFQTAGVKVGLFEGASSINVPAPGVYVPPTVSVTMMKDVVTIDFESKTYKKLNPKFLPETVVMAERPDMGGETVILPETELMDEDGAFILTTPFAADLEDGKTYAVTFYGETYDCKAVYLVEEGGMSGFVLGNIPAESGLTGGNPDAPFMMIYSHTGGIVGQESVYCLIRLTARLESWDGVSPVTLSIVQTGAATPKQLVMDKDGNIKWEDRTHWVEGGTYDILPEATYTDDASIEAGLATPLSHALVAGEVYQVNYNGTIYKCTCISVTESGITIPVLGNTDMMSIPGGNPDAPFVFMEIPRGIPDAPENMYWQLLSIDDGSYPLTFGIKYEGEIVHKIDNKFLDIAPSNWNALPGTPGYIENRTHYCDHIVMTYDPAKLAGVDTLAVDFGSNPITFYKIGDYALDAAALKASSYTITTLSTGEQSTTTVTMAQDNNGISTGMAPAFFIYSIHDLAAASAQGVNAPSTGTYMVVISEEACTVTVDSGEIIKKIDEKYLPTLEEMGSNLIRGSAEGSTRSINSKAESDVYVIGKYATSIGLETEAHGEGSLAEGHRSKAFGNGSHAEGFDTSARGGESHAEGYKAIAFGSGSHAEGWSTAAIGLGSHAEGSGDVYEIKLTGDANSRIYTYTNSSWPHNTVMYGYVIQYGDTFATIDKYTNTTLSLSKTLSSEALSDANAFIYTGVAFGERSHSEGYECAAADNNSHAEGSCTKAIGYCSHSQGVQSIAAGSSSHAQGWYTMASGDYAVADGFYTRALGTISHAAGWDTESFGRSQFVIGEHNKISAKARYSDETKTTSLPTRTAPYTIWKLPGAHVNIVSQTSLEMNGEYRFDGDILPVDDYTTLVVGDYIALSKNTKTCYYELLTPITEEDQTYKAEVIEHTIVDNYSKRGEYVFVIGNGNPDVGNSPASNAHAIDWDGNAYFAGDVYVQGNGKTIGFDGKKKLATEEYVNAQITAIDYPVDSVNGKTGNVTLTASDVGADASGSAAAALTESKEYADNQIDSAIDALPQTDWSQNDPEAADYVKNRTHYEDIEYILSETTVALKPVYGAMGSLPFASVPVNGNTYDVTYNGKSYSVVANVVYGCVFETSDFMILYMGNNMGQIQTFDGSATATISISGDVDGTYSELLAETTVPLQATNISAGTITEPFNGEIAADTTYDVMYNGTLYSATRGTSPVGLYLADANSVVYITLPTNDVLPKLQIKEDVTEATISIYRGTIHKLDAKYLPDGLATKDYVDASAYTHPTYTALTGAPTANATPAFGGTFSVSQPVSDATGHITAINSRTITIPSSTATTSKAGLMSTTDKSKLNGIEAGAQVNVQSDWNQNDTAATDYVKNRTHWVEDVRTTLVGDTTFTYSSPTGHGITFASFIEGQTYTVTWDGVEYECVAYNVTGPSVPGIGNNGFVGGGADTGEPFLFFVHSSTSYIYASTSGTYTFSIASGKLVVHQLDAKYIPEAKNSNIVNGSASGSIRMTHSAEESNSYEMGYDAFAEGSNTKASGYVSHAEGEQSIASGGWSHAENCATTASGNASHAEGRYTIASGDSQHVQGKYNIEDKNNTYAHIVGNGYYDGSTATRVYSNAHTLDWDGNAWFAGNVYIGGTGQDDTAAVKLITQAEMEAYVNESILGGAW